MCWTINVHRQLSARSALSLCVLCQVRSYALISRACEQIYAKFVAKDAESLVNLDSQTQKELHTIFAADHLAAKQRQWRIEAGLVSCWAHLAWQTCVSLEFGSRSRRTVSPRRAR